jgi:hypothetical protein
MIFFNAVQVFLGDLPTINVQLKTIDFKQGLKNGTERNGTERYNGIFSETERNGTENIRQDEKRKET